MVYSSSSLHKPFKSLGAWYISVHLMCAGDTSDSEDEDKNKDGSGERRGAGLSGGPSSSSSANPSRFPSIPSRHINRRPRTRR